MSDQTTTSTWRELSEFDEDSVCWGYIGCDNPPTEQLIVESSGGWIMKLCQSCTTRMANDHRSIALQNVKLAASVRRT